MQDSPIEARRGPLWLTTDRRRLDPAAALALLQTTYWGHTLSLERLTRAIENSVCFGVFEAQTLVAFGRVITDLATYAYWTDVVVADAYRRQGIGRWLSETMLAHPQLQGFRRVSLLTRDAVRLYGQLGFKPTADTLTYMEYRAPAIPRGRPAA
jgi:GNAT superfamily N-acetyltransferase